MSYSLILISTAKCITYLLVKKLTNKLIWQITIVSNLKSYHLGLCYKLALHLKTFQTPPLEYCLMPLGKSLNIIFAGMHT